MSNIRRKKKPGKKVREEPDADRLKHGSFETIDVMKKTVVQ